MNENGKVMTDAEIVAGLRSEVPEERQKALDALYPDVIGSGGALLIRSRATQAETSSTRGVNAGRMFITMLQLAQLFGAHLGLQLGWVQKPEDGGKILPATQMPRHFFK